MSIQDNSVHSTPKGRAIAIHCPNDIGIPDYSIYLDKMQQQQK
jgi:uncharacterized short protein YbdD (DUF466 family)